MRQKCKQRFPYNLNGQATKNHSPCTHSRPRLLSTLDIFSVFYIYILTFLDRVIAKQLKSMRLVSTENRFNFNVFLHVWVKWQVCGAGCQLPAYFRAFRLKVIETINWNFVKRNETQAEIWWMYWENCFVSKCFFFISLFGSLYLNKYPYKQEYKHAILRSLASCWVRNLQSQTNEMFKTPNIDFFHHKCVLTLVLRW